MGTGGDTGLVTEDLRLVRPEADQVLSRTAPFVFSWTQVGRAALYRVELRNEAGEEVLPALLRLAGRASVPPRKASWSVKSRSGSQPRGGFFGL